MDETIERRRHRAGRQRRKEHLAWNVHFLPAAFSEGVQYGRDGGKYVVVGQFMNAGPAEGFHPFWITFKELMAKGS